MARVPSLLMGTPYGAVMHTQASCVGRRARLSILKLLYCKEIIAHYIDTSPLLRDGAAAGHRVGIPPRRPPFLGKSGDRH